MELREALFYALALRGVNRGLNLVRVAGAQFDGFEAGSFELLDDGFDVPVFEDVVCDRA